MGEFLLEQTKALFMFGQITLEQALDLARILFSIPADEAKILLDKWQKDKEKFDPERGRKDW